MFRNRNTVFSSINGHSKRWMPLISGQFFFHRPNSGQSLIKNFHKKADTKLAGTLNNGYYFLHEIVNLGFFTLQIVDGPKVLETRIEKMTKLNGFSSI